MGEDAFKPKQPAKSYALWLLSRREWGAVELERRLLSKGYDAQETAQALALLQSHGLQSDERFAGMKARGQANRHGNWRVARSLREAGLDESLIEAQLEALPDELSRAIAAARRFEGSEPTQPIRVKFWRFLAARGFASSVIGKAWSAMLESGALAFKGEAEQDAAAEGAFSEEHETPDDVEPDSLD